jgi:hypothetical protein
MLAATHMKKSVPVANATVLKTFARNFDWSLNHVEPESKAISEAPKQSDK